MYASKWIDRIDSVGVWLLLALVFLFILTGYGMTKHLMDPVLAKYIHVQLLPLPLFVLFIIHILKPVYQQFKKWKIFKNEATLNFYVYLLALLSLTLCLWLYWR